MCKIWYGTGSRLFDRPGPVSGVHCSLAGLDAAASGWLDAAAGECPSGSAFTSTFTAASLPGECTSAEGAAASAALPPLPAGCTAEVLLAVSPAFPPATSISQCDRHRSSVVCTQQRGGMFKKEGNPALVSLRRCVNLSCRRPLAT